ncbi:uncharacterized protein EV422DRAFT_129770 [Fimicolochytrium jonesii]|uniref:uncharacterized protein n=1 Tax=Fimicolochytrium jonesii TaxID=1396493 RepID=UPI0022FE1EB1|nr:uncharacterized protein EV422DRAFT_129770 [Fimicolochytrium jonesii]KAI8819005.1 hypothetical protein EV422DRAFT_129770 [Fimicolochytrium jonesii]
MPDPDWDHVRFTKMTSIITMAHPERVVISFVIAAFLGSEEEEEETWDYLCFGYEHGRLFFEKSPLHIDYYPGIEPLAESICWMYCLEATSFEVCGFGLRRIPNAFPRLRTLSVAGDNNIPSAFLWYDLPATVTHLRLQYDGTVDTERVLLVTYLPNTICTLEVAFGAYPMMLPLWTNRNPARLLRYAPPQPSGSMGEAEDRWRQSRTAYNGGGKLEIMFWEPLAGSALADTWYEESIHMYEARAIESNKFDHVRRVAVPWGKGFACTHWGDFGLGKSLRPRLSLRTGIQAPIPQPAFPDMPFGYSCYSTDAPGEDHGAIGNGL